ncbi:MAG: hypothetical protein GY850_08035 [bacterium]|nr:hypothetical protein [bacterium]
MVRTILLICAFSMCLAINNGFCNEKSPSPDPATINTKETGESENPVEKPESSFWRKVWGKKARNAALLGMWSLHVDGTGEYFGSGGNNDQGELVGLQYWGLAAGTFMNSKDDRAWFLGPAREVYSHDFTEYTRFDIGYKFGLLYGYGDDLINVAGMSVYATATFGLTWRRLGFDFGIVPAGVLTGNFRVDIDF